jgi:hypothetical protein
VTFQLTSHVSKRPPESAEKKRKKKIQEMITFELSNERGDPAR